MIEIVLFLEEIYETELGIINIHCDGTIGIKWKMSYDLLHTETFLLYNLGSSVSDLIISWT